MTITLQNFLVLLSSAVAARPFSAECACNLLDAERELGTFCAFIVKATRGTAASLPWIPSLPPDT
jgi:hypothetical protein